MNKYIIILLIPLLPFINCISLNDTLVLPVKYSKVDYYLLDTILTEDIIPKSNWKLFTLNKNNISLNALWIKAKADTSLPFQVKTVLFFDGNASNLHCSAFFGKVLYQVGVNVLCIEYRGFGKSYGTLSPNEETLFTDGTAAYDYLLDSLGIEENDCVIFGFSIGSTAAVEMAKNNSPIGLFLIAAISTADYQANEITGDFNIPADWFTSSKLDNLSKISSIACPVCFVHGKSDATIPYHCSEILYKKAKEPKDLFLNNNDHMEIYWNDKYWSEIFNNFVQNIDIIH